MRKVTVAWLFLLVFWSVTAAHAADIFLRYRVITPEGEKWVATIGGFRHSDPWYMPTAKLEAEKEGWSPWADLSAWPWHGQMKRAGGVAEWPAATITLEKPGAPKLQGIMLEVQLADKADAAAVVHTFREKSASNMIGFLVPHPLREKHGDFETGSQMAARHAGWAKAAAGPRPPQPKLFHEITALWGHYDPDLARQELSTLKTLGFNVVGNIEPKLIQEAGLRTYGHTWTYQIDPDAATKEWKQYVEGPLARQKATPEGEWLLKNMVHYVLSDEVSTLHFKDFKDERLQGWFRDYLRQKGVRAVDLGKPVEEIVYPAAAMHEKTLPREADGATRRLMYHAAKFGQWWSARALGHSSKLVKADLAGIKTETLPTDHGFFNAWGPPYIGMSYRLLDLFELGAQGVVDQLSAEDWMGLNHMYGPNYTWSGGQSFAYWNALLRSAADLAPAGQPIMLRSLITPSDDHYLRLKSHSALAQGSKSFFFWTYGPTYIGTENYWSDLRSEYDGIARLHHTLERAEDILYPARVVRDPVAVLYSVSHDIWNTDDPAAFVEKRLLWHGLRHLQVQPDFLREEEVTAGRLAGYKALFITDWCISRAASRAIDEWVRQGGVVYLSAGAATRDEYYDLYVPPFAEGLWEADAALKLTTEKHSYNERTSLPNIKPLTQVNLRQGAVNWSIPVLGVRSALKATSGGANSGAVDGVFSDGTPALRWLRHGQGTVLGLGFLPMLAYAQAAGFKPATLEEKWPEEPRRILASVLRTAGVAPRVTSSVPVVETGLLTGPRGSALVLANYTYAPIGRLQLDLQLPPGSPVVQRATSTEGKPVRLQKTPMGVRVELALDQTDVVLLHPPATRPPRRQ